MEHLVGGAMPPEQTIPEAELNDVSVKTLPIRSRAKFIEARDNLLEALKSHTVPKIPKPAIDLANSNRGNIVGTIGRTQTFGWGDTRRGWNYYKTNKKYPEVFKALIAFGNQVVPKGWEYQGITLNHEVKSKKHIDGKNIGLSVIIGIGDFTGGEIKVWRPDDTGGKNYDLHDKPVMFNGGVCPHETQPFKGNRYTFVFYKQGRHPRNSKVGIGSGHCANGLTQRNPYLNGGVFA